MSQPHAALLAVLGAPADTIFPPLPPTLLVTAHPGDESAGAGTRLPRLAGARFVCVTDGAPGNGEDASRHAFTPEEYARARRQDLQTALVRCGIAPGRLSSLGAPDQQAALRLAPLARQLAERIVSFGSEIVLTQPYEGEHPDRDATAFAVHAAVALLHARGLRAPAILEMASRRGFLPLPPGSEDNSVRVALTPPEQCFKKDLLACFATQAPAFRDFPLASESFRVAPRYDFRAPPHPGPLRYEHEPWGMRGERFRALAARALEELGLEGALRGG